MFKALADPTRRGLLDELFEQDGQTLSALEERLPMTRFGVMKHLRVLEEAGLVATRRRGREKLHFLNPVPIRLVHDRWVSKYAEPWAATLTGLKRQLEEETMDAVDVPHRVPLSPDPDGAGAMAVFEIYIKTTPERLWEAITDPELRAQVQLRGRDPLGLDARLELPGLGPRRRRHRGGREPRGRSRRAGSCRASTRSGATTSRPPGPRG